MQSSTISVSPLPPGTTADQVREIFHAFSVKNVHIDSQTAYVEFSDEGDLETIQIQFDNYEVPELNNAKIDKAEFDWNSIRKDNSSPDKKSDSSSDKHQDLMAADLDNLIIIEDCDKMFLDGLSEENMRDLFKDFHSINRIVKRGHQVIVQFTEAGQMEKLEAKFPGFKIPQLGWKSRIQKADPTKITAQQFVAEWSKLHAKESLITQPTIGYEEKERKTSNGSKSEENKFGFDSIESKPSQTSQQVLHQDIIPPFDKKTSMEVNFLNQQSKLGYNEQKQHQPIHEATTHQQLDFSSQVNIDRDQEKLGYEAAQKKQKQEQEKEAEEKRKQQEEAEQKRVQQQEQNQRKRKDQELMQRRRKQQEQEAQRKKKQEQQQRKRKEQEAREKERQKRQKEDQQARIKYEEEARKRRQQEEAERLAAEEQNRRRRQSEALDKELKEKLYAQRLKHEKEQQEKLAKEQKHEAPTQSDTVAQQTEFIKQAGKTIQQQLGYAVNMAKAESANLVNVGLEILRGQEQKIQQKLGYSAPTNQQAAHKPQPKTQELGYKKQSPKETGLDLLNSSFQFLKGSYNKIQQKIETIATKGKEVSHPSEMGYEKWTVKPDVNVPRPVVGQQPTTLKTLITITLLIWVIFLLMQDTSSVQETVHHEVEIDIPSVEVTQQSVAPQASNL